LVWASKGGKLFFGGFETGCAIATAQNKHAMATGQKNEQKKPPVSGFGVDGWRIGKVGNKGESTTVLGFKHKTLRAASQFLAENLNLTSLCRQML
jgi:hypothetical protein